MWLIFQEKWLISSPRMIPVRIRFVLHSNKICSSFERVCFLFERVYSSFERVCSSFERVYFLFENGLFLCSQSLNFVFYFLHFYAEKG